MAPTLCCLICSDDFSPQNSKPEDEVAEILTETFQVFGKYMSWDSLGGNQFDFASDPFPFCSACKAWMFEVTNLDREANKIFGRISQIVNSASGKILKSLENKRWDKNGTCGGKQQGKKQKGDGISLERKIEHYRNVTVKEYSPKVMLTKPSWDMDNVSEDEDQQSEPQILLSSEDSARENFEDESDTSIVVITENKHGNGKLTCTKCDRKFLHPRSLSRHVAVSCESNVEPNTWVKISRSEFSFDRFLIKKEDGEYKCVSCSQKFKNTQNIKYHIHNVHSGKTKSDIKDQLPISSKRAKQALSLESNPKILTASNGSRQKKNNKIKTGIKVATGRRGTKSTTSNDLSGVKRKLLGKNRQNILVSYASLFRLQDKY